ncbi:kinase-like domain-containing protein [Rhizophagus irregularis DAOM 181602=DAOM 197198]|uniref:Serine-threonine/tyrosine-protein kinase catalytic domain-containing protein n=2 Tax=Rhizophagus irregularis TaxID=588596 RepID=A0A2N1N5S3_9GLOM|nr:hypothetical protein GLOIN_2v1769153 [Rhizophagus irregularis DAOM 181602=DAOM 197198]PKK69208.1 hypothetical protein RhiirC2_781283 [Rhizophagus irregularis]POG76345.1 hypothetical protein GLOIN_2v1769153 [Rhizophagus irregularis DAOM 181602=DAOM 197198]GET57798.1 kinase-like domain-containing protein [Rhizophagus irregularis DAOM 181602=DAOM 197198]|eukprot:XP_025183211.1 hypothetical protein GLOIN_2v1769153 [Rhizophagus irregularis DAOM 181602=DAOM 197198]
MLCELEGVQIIDCEDGYHLMTEEVAQESAPLDSIILYMAPEIFIDKKYTTSSDTHSFRMTICEFMTDRRPFWNKILVIELIIKICDGKMNYDTNAP